MSKPSQIRTMIIGSICAWAVSATAEKATKNEVGDPRVLPEETASKETLPPEQRYQPTYEQDDHIHYTPDQAFSRFEEMDSNSNREVTWNEAKDHTDQLQYKEFKRLDTDGSGTLDREEYVGIAPDHSNDYQNKESLEE